LSKKPKPTIMAKGTNTSLAMAAEIKDYLELVDLNDHLPINTGLSYFKTISPKPRSVSSRNEIINEIKVRGGQAPQGQL
jgi:hypothetical protein